MLKSLFFNSKNKRNCLNCVYFCRDRHYWITYQYPIDRDPFWKYDKHSLSGDQRKMLDNDNFSFVGLEQREWKRFNEEFEKRENQTKTGLNILDSLTETFKEKAIRLGFNKDEIPTYKNPNIDQLDCHLSQWKKTVTPDSNFLKSFSCEYYFPFKNNEDLDLDAVVNKQKRLLELENATTSKRSLKIALISLVVSMIAIFAPIFFKEKNQTKKQEELLEKTNTTLESIDKKITTLNSNQPNKKIIKNLPKTHTKTS